MVREAESRSDHENLIRIITLLEGANGGGVLKRLNHHGEQIDELANKCSDMDKRISINAVKIGIITASTGLGAGSVAGVIVKYLGG